MSPTSCEFAQTLSSIMAVLGCRADALLSLDSVALDLCAVERLGDARRIEVASGLCGRSVVGFFADLLPGAAWHLRSAERASTGGRVTVLCFVADDAVVEVKVTDDADEEFERASMRLIPASDAAAAAAIAEERRAYWIDQEARCLASSLALGLGRLLGSPRAAAEHVLAHLPR